MISPWFCIINVVTAMTLATNFSSAQACPHGRYGATCELTCPSNCEVLNPRKGYSFPGPCNKTTGHCAEGCKPGFHSSTCNETCVDHCKTCYQEKGECIVCINGNAPNNNRCILKEEKYLLPEKETTHITNLQDKGHESRIQATVNLGKTDRSLLITIAVVVILFFIVIVLILIVVIVIKCHRKQKKCESEKPESDEEANLASNEIEDTYHLVWAIFMILPVQSSAQCSNCVENKCKKSGECPEGCDPGSVDIRCQRICPPNCINNTCHLDRQRGTYVCSDGCQDGYCGSGCKLHCPNGCTTCDRASCTICNVTSCVGNRYGEECTPCPENFEKCDKDTGQCIKCKKGFYGESCETRCPSCLSRGQELLQGCQTGCDVCSKGLRGKEVCSSNCLSNHCDSSGRCTLGCKAFFYGRKCDAICNFACTGFICQQNSGRCVNGCIYGYVQTDNGCEMSEGLGSKWILPIVTIVLGVCILTLAIPVWIIMRKISNKSSRAFYKDMQEKHKDDAVCMKPLSRKLTDKQDIPPMGPAEYMALISRTFTDKQDNPIGPAECVKPQSRKLTDIQDKHIVKAECVNPQLIDVKDKQLDQAESATFLEKTKQSQIV